ncbi:class I SAM-dependent methyltransferase [Candidatus Babeliales bacterium]|nr:class I SAM-dependent methyltransferase [Candidatus Babeliales bacterium]
MKKTDWNLYYEKPYKIALLSRRITGNLLVKFIRKYCKQPIDMIIEIGGANSCFYDLIQKEVNPSEYIIMDNNQYGLDKFSERIKKQDKNNVSLINNDILNPIKYKKVDLVFSVGLVEHFSEQGTKVAIENHFRYVKDGGIVIIGFPTPTFLYKIVRKISEVLGMWMFPDERPIKISEAIKIFNNNVIILEKKILWPILLTQAFFVARKIKI